MTVIPDARTSIESMNRRAAELFERADADAIAEGYTDDARVFAPGAGSVSGREEIAQLIQEAMAAGMKKVRMKTEELESFGDTAHEVGRYTFRSGDDEVLDEGYYLVVWKLVGDRWKIHRDMWATSLAPTAD